MADWLVGIIVLFLLWTLVRVSARREPPAPPISNLKFEVVNRTAPQAQTRRMDRNKFVKEAA